MMLELKIHNSEIFHRTSKPKSHLCGVFPQYENGKVEDVINNKRGNYFVLHSDL